MGRNILIFSDGTGQAGGFMPDEARSNVYKLFRATRVCPDSSIDPKRQIAFYDAGLGSRAQAVSVKLKWWRRIYNLLSRATGLGITQNIIDCYAEIIRVWQPGDRIYLFGFSRGAYTARCVGGVLKYCGVPTAVRQKWSGRALPLQRDLKSARRIASEAVKQVYQYGGSRCGDPLRAEREKRAIRFRTKYFSGDTHVSNTAPYFIGVWDTIETLGAGWSGLGLLGAVYEALSACLTWLCARPPDWAFWILLFLFGIGLPASIYAAACLRYRGLVSLAKYRMAFYDTKLNYAVRYARHALSIDENRNKFACVLWDEEPQRQAFTDQAGAPARFKQVWFAGNHSDIGGSYPENESRLSDISLSWMVQEATHLPEPILIDYSTLQLYPDHVGTQHDERKAFTSACPAWLLRCALLFVSERNFGWRAGYRKIPDDAVLHPSVLDRFKLPGILNYDDIRPYRPEALRAHPAVRSYWARTPAWSTAPRQYYPPPRRRPHGLRSASYFQRRADR
jgi:uncharacterized protein (DUF2235 family)